MWLPCPSDTSFWNNSCIAADALISQHETISVCITLACSAYAAHYLAGVLYFALPMAVKLALCCSTQCP